MVEAGHGLSGAILALVLPLILMSVFSLFSIRKSLVLPAIAQYATEIKILLAFGGFALLAGSLELVQTYVDSLMIGYFMTDVDVGLYAVAIVFGQALQLPSLAIQMVTKPMIATYWGRGEIDNIENLVNNIMKLVAAFIIPVGFALAFLSHSIITLIFGADYTSATLPLQILLIGSVCFGIITSVGSALSSTAYVTMIFKISGITMVTNIVLNLLLIPRLGITGAATATSTSFMIASLLNLYFMQHLIRIKIHWDWFGRFFCFAIILAGATYGLGLVVNHYICVFIAIIIFILILLKYFIKGGDLSIIRKMIPVGKGRHR